MLACLVDGTEQLHVCVSDRGLHYGDGLFETVALHDGRPRRWSLHWQRLQSGCARLRLTQPDEGQLLADLAALPSPKGFAVGKIIITRGSGGRGYRVPADSTSTRIVGLYSWPSYPEDWIRQGIRIRWCDTPLGCNPKLAGLKHLNRLEQVLGRSEWDDPQIAEGLMCDPDGRPIAGTMSNLFIVSSGVARTPSVDGCGVEGVMRRSVLDYCRANGLRYEIAPLSRAELYQADEIFLTNALIGIWPVRELDGHRLQAPGPFTAALRLRLGLERE